MQKAIIVSTWNSPESFYNPKAIVLIDKELKLIGEMDDFKKMLRKSIVNNISLDAGKLNLKTYFFDATFNFNNEKLFVEKCNKLSDLFDEWFEDDEETPIVFEFDDRYIPLFEACSIRSEKPELLFYPAVMVFKIHDSFGDDHESKDIPFNIIKKGVSYSIKW